MGAAHVGTNRLISAETGAFALSAGRIARALLQNVAVVLVVDAGLGAIVVVEVADRDVLALVLGSLALI